MTAKIPGPGKNVATLRKARGVSQTRLARRAGISLSLLSKVEIGDRALSQAVAASLARALGVTLDELLGRTAVREVDEASLRELRMAMRRFDLPGPAEGDADELRRDLGSLFAMRANADLTGALHLLPGVLSRATNHAHAAGDPALWEQVTDAYSAVYWLAARHRWMDLADLAVARQRNAAQRAGALARAVAARDEAGAFLNFGDFEGGLAVVDRAVVAAESRLTGRERAFALGLLHLRGMTLAGRARDGDAVARHQTAAWRAAGQFPEDVNDHGIHVGPQNTATHVLATSVDMERHRAALDVLDDIRRHPSRLPATRRGPVFMNAARARLALRDRDGALDALNEAWEAAPQMAKVHPTSQELLRVLTSLHRRSNPRLMTLAKRAGVVV